jgi:hypothetical protein
MAPEPCRFVRKTPPSPYPSRNIGFKYLSDIEYARLSVPLLAALIASGHVRKGDLIELPLPHPEAWPATVAYIYTGRDEPTTTVKENITYLTGKVPLA